MKILLDLLSFLAAPAFAATTISTTLTMTSPSAYISMTGDNSMANFYYVSATSISTTLISSTSPNILKAWVKFAGGTGITSTAAVLSGYNVRTVSRTGAGLYAVNFATPLRDNLFAVNCMARGTLGGGNFYTGFSQTAGQPSPTTGGFNMGTFDSGGVPIDSNDVQCTVFGN